MIFDLDIRDSGSRWPTEVKLVSQWMKCSFLASDTVDWIELNKKWKWSWENQL